MRLSLWRLVDVAGLGGGGECLVEQVGGVSLHVRGDMTVAVQRHANVSVTKTFLHDLRVLSLGQQQRGAGVPEVMEPDLREPLNLDSFSVNQARTKRDEADRAVTSRIPETYQWLLVPHQENPRSAEINWEEFRVHGEGAIAVRARQRLRNEGLLYTEWNGTLLRRELDSIPLWRGDHVSVKQLADDFAQYLYLPRLKNSEVLLDAIASGVANVVWTTETFGVAERFEQSTNRYHGLKAGEHVRPILNADTVLVKPDVALRQIEQDKSLVDPPIIDGGGNGKHEGGTDAGGETGGDTGPTPPPPPPVRKTRRYWAIVEIDPTAIATQPAKIGREIVQHLAALPDGQVTVTIEIDVRIANGIPDDLKRVLNENSQALRFKEHGFDED